MSLTNDFPDFEMATIQKETLAVGDNQKYKKVRNKMQDSGKRNLLLVQAHLKSGAIRSIAIHAAIKKTENDKALDEQRKQSIEKLQN
uniref:YdeI/OmpD-associated family protein n=1 Tax=Heterorhabditis bacteriophora TaxID=37862 RepID=A0A1I7WPD6_HETBA